MHLANCFSSSFLCCLKLLLGWVYLYMSNRQVAAAVICSLSVNKRKLVKEKKKLQKSADDNHLIQLM